MRLLKSAVWFTWTLPFSRYKLGYWNIDGCGNRREWAGNNMLASSCELS